MMKRIPALCLLLLVFFQASASHIVGSDIYYDYLGNNQYRITVTLFRDCASDGAQFDNPMSLSIYDANNSLVHEYQVPFPGSVTTPVDFENPCVSAPSGICVESATYQVIVSLPPSVNGYTVSYQRCCYGPSVSNLINPEGTGLTLTTHITGTGTNAFNNSSPRFVNYPPLVICNNEDLNMSHHATDPDGDSLVYDLVTPFQGGTEFNPMPVPSGGPPFANVVWEAGFNANNPLGSGSSTNINSATGHLFADANQLGKFVVAIRVREYRNGVLIGSTTRAFIFRVVNCIIQLSADIGTQEESPLFESYCQGLHWVFDNQSFGGDTYEWDFGVPGSTTDVSTQFEPEFTYPAPGIYVARLVVNPGWPCTDTAYVTLNLNNELQVDFTYTDSLCFDGNSVDFQGQIVVGNPAASVEWIFPPQASIQTANTLAVNGVNFTSGGSHDVWLKGHYGICRDSVMHPIFIFPDPTPIAELPDNFQCEGLTQHFINNSTDASIFSWDFGVPGTNTDVSSEQSPTFTFPAPGTYTVTLTASIPQGCSSTVAQNYTFYEPLSVSFTHTDSLCITDNDFDFDATVSGPGITTLLWNFGPNADPPTATTEAVSGVTYSTYGHFPVTLTASFLTCSESASSAVFVFREPEINFGLVPGLQCAPFPAQFIDSSVADTPIQYFWDFGDGGSSNEQDPLHIYTVPGQYPVTLNIVTTEGCKDTLSLTKDNLIFVRPTPVAGFTVTPDKTDICHSTIAFTDQSTGGIRYVYIFDDGDLTTASEEQNPYYGYYNYGYHYPLQIVENEFGCSDSAKGKIFIEPYTVYIPNAFTPDADEFNPTFRTFAALEAVEWDFKIYNRWGELVFETDDQHDEWDGTYKGVRAMPGVYTYKLRYISCANGERWEELTGHVTLVR
jgi:gliding motility-associated-like protein